MGLISWLLIGLVICWVLVMFLMIGRWLSLLCIFVCVMCWGSWCGVILWKYLFEFVRWVYIDCCVGVSGCVGGYVG